MWDKPNPRVKRTVISLSPSPPSHQTEIIHSIFTQGDGDHWRRPATTLNPKPVRSKENVVEDDVEVEDDYEVEEGFAPLDDDEENDYYVGVDEAD